MEIKYKISYNRLAQSDIETIADYICNTLFAPIALQKLLSKIRKTIENLAYFPFSGKALKDKKQLNLAYRWISVDSYMIFYNVDTVAQTVVISRILYGASNYSKQL